MARKDVARVLVICDDAKLGSALGDVIGAALSERRLDVHKGHNLFAEGFCMELPGTILIDIHTEQFMTFHGHKD